MRKRAFTLIELLVVIAIIAILAAILFPVFAQAKAAAKKTQSLSNIKQLALAVKMYQTDYDDVYPVGCGSCWWQPRDGGWTYGILPYMKNWEILRSPGDPKDKAGWQSWTKTHPDFVHISYASNGVMIWQDNNWGMRGVMGLNQKNGTECGWFDGPGVTPESAVNNVATTVMFTERNNSAPTWGPSNFFAGVTWWDGAGYPGAWPDGTRDGTPYRFRTDWGSGAEFIANMDNRNGAVSTNWQNKAAFAWTDGHASVVSPISTNPDPTNRPQDNLWNAYRP
ncbi:MAG: DUF1559 domain-containing protein [Fimbriimonadales bacterium]